MKAFHQRGIHRHQLIETLNRSLSYEIHLKFTNVHRGVYTEILLHKGCQPKGKV